MRYLRNVILLSVLVVTMLGLDSVPASALMNGTPALSTSPISVQGGANFTIFWDPPTGSGFTETGWPTVLFDGGTIPPGATELPPDGNSTHWRVYFSAGVTPGTHTFVVSYVGDTQFAAGSASVQVNAGKYNAPYFFEGCYYPDVCYTTPQAGKPFTISGSPNYYSIYAPLPVTGTVDAYFNDSTGNHYLATAPVGQGNVVTFSLQVYTLGMNDLDFYYSGDQNYQGGSVGFLALRVSSQIASGHGYRVVRSDGSAYNSNNTNGVGDLAGQHLNQPVVGAASTPDGKGYWEVARDGGIFSFGDAQFYGSTGSLHLNQPVVGMTSTPDGGGYWFVASDGGIFAYGDAKFFGSMGGSSLNKPVVGMASTPDGGGYWLVASDGGIFSFGDAQFYGSTGSIKLNKPIVGMSTTPDGHGYLFVASDGGVFTYGDARFEGSLGGTNNLPPVVSMVLSDDGGGYLLTLANGDVRAFGDATVQGTAAGVNVVAIINGN